MRSAPVLCGLAAWLAADLAAARPSLCTAGEVPVFSCATTGRKVVSLCASPDLSETAGSLRYRFGRPSGVEMTYPDDQTPPKAAFRAGIIGAGGGDFVRFTRSDVTYTIEHADGPRSGQYAGVTIHRGPKRVAELRCKGTPYDALGPDGFALIYRAKLPSELYGLSDGGRRRRRWRDRQAEGLAADETGLDADHHQTVVDPEPGRGRCRSGSEARNGRRPGARGPRHEEG